jgi:ribosome-associated translation inhibitor RaiA
MTSKHTEFIEKLREDIDEMCQDIERMRDDTWDFDPSVSIKEGTICEAMAKLNCKEDVQKAYDALYRALDNLIDEFSSIPDNLEEQFEDEDELEESEEVDYEPIDFREECDR